MLQVSLQLCAYLMYWVKKKKKEEKDDSIRARFYLNEKCVVSKGYFKLGLMQ